MIICTKCGISKLVGPCSECVPFKDFKDKELIISFFTLLRDYYAASAEKFSYGVEHNKRLSQECALILMDMDNIFNYPPFVGMINDKEYLKDIKISAIKRFLDN